LGSARNGTFDFRSKLPDNRAREIQMFHLREIITVLCLVLLAWTLLAPVAAPDILIVLPVIAALLIALVSSLLPQSAGFRFHVLDPSLASNSVRAPPLN